MGIKLISKMNINDIIIYFESEGAKELILLIKKRNEFAHELYVNYIYAKY